MAVLIGNESNRTESNGFCFVIARIPSNVDKTAFWISSMMYSLGVYVCWISYSDRNQLKSFNQNKNTALKAKNEPIVSFIVQNYFGGI